MRCEIVVLGMWLVGAMHIKKEQGIWLQVSKHNHQFSTNAENRNILVDKSITCQGKKHVKRGKVKG